ncbi:MAG TPA: ABC transporter ATP-binding protein [Candidatus Saccharimonadales bacterium]|nr:ABC transporter ATP-binding protein [Candidatus Saccharimonadales bacterium]
MSKLPDDIAIRVHNIHKEFHLPHENADSIKERVITVFHKKDKGVDIHRALRGVSFDIKKGEFFGVVGRNGSGKSTLLKLIANIYAPTSGTSDYQGKLVAFIELGVGFNVQLSGKDNVYLNGAMLGFSRKEIDAMYDEIVAFAELDKFMHQKLKNYSSGMKVRLAFSVAIRAKADILILDEVLAVGDAAFKRKCYDYFRNLKEEHKTIVLVSHSMGLIKEYCDRAILIEDGKIAYEGDAEEVADKYNELFGPNINNEAAGTDAVVELVDCRAKFSEDKIDIEAEFRSKETIKGAVLVTKLTRGRHTLAGTNSERLGFPSGIDFEKDKPVSVKITLENNIVATAFDLGFTLKSKDGMHNYGFWLNVISYESGSESTGFPVEMAGKMEIGAKPKLVKK